MQNDLVENIIDHLTNQIGELEERLLFADGADPVYTYLEGAVEVTEEYLQYVKDLYNE